MSLYIIFCISMILKMIAAIMKIIPATAGYAISLSSGYDLPLKAPLACYNDLRALPGIATFGCHSGCRLGCRVTMIVNF